MGYRYDWDEMRWIPNSAPSTRSGPKPPHGKRRVNRATLLRGLAEEIAFEESLAKLYAGLLADVIVENNPMLKSEYRRICAALAA